MYNNKLVACVKANGKVLREDKDTVYLPFGSEYSLLIKNLNTVRALASIVIDGTDVLDGEKLVIPANGEVDLQRFIQNGNQDKGHRFKFVERTSKVEQHRGVGAVDGLIQVTFQFEKRIPISVPQLIEHVHHYHTYRPYYQFAHYPWRSSEIICGSLSSQDTFSEKCYSAQAQVSSKGLLRGLDSQLMNTSATMSASSSLGQNSAQTMDSYFASHEPEVAMAAPTASANEVGITVQGSVSEQKFHTVSEFPLEVEEYSIVLNLKGQTEKAKVKAPVTVKTKKKCNVCGTVSKWNAKFCRECTASLEVL